jgi:hypothetical protein
MSTKPANAARMEAKKRFIPGLVLSEGYFHDLVEPFLAAYFPGLQYSAALIGHCSDVLGFDTYISMDHFWGPRLQIFLAEADQRQYAAEIKRVLSENLPQSYRGFPTNWLFDQPDSGDHPVFAPDGKINPNVEILTVREFVKSDLGVDYAQIKLRNWLAFSEQELLHQVAGKIFHSGLSELEAMRAYFQYYPEPIWLLRMYALWSSIAEEQAFVGRCHAVKDELGERLVATRIVNKLMKLCFYLERKYYPYSKWFGTAFAKLECAAELTPIFHQVLAGRTYKQRERALCTAYLKVAEKHNALGITAPVTLEIENYYGRGYFGFQTLQVVAALGQAIKPEILQELGLPDLDGDAARILNSEPLLDDSNYTRSPLRLQKMLFK